MDTGWLTTRNKTKVQPKVARSKYRTSLPRQRSSSPSSIVLMTQSSPPPKQLFSATKQSSLTQFFKPIAGYDEMQEIPYRLESTQITDQIKYTNCNEQLDTDKRYTHVKSSQVTENELNEIKWKSSKSNPEEEVAPKCPLGVTRTKRKHAKDSESVENNCLESKLIQYGNVSGSQYSMRTDTEAKLQNGNMRHKRLKISYDLSDVNKNNEVRLKHFSDYANNSNKYFEVKNMKKVSDSGTCENYGRNSLSDDTENTHKDVDVNRSGDSDQCFDGLNHDECTDTPASLSFLHNTSETVPTLDFHTNATHSLDLDNDFTLQSQKERYDSMERHYKHLDDGDSEILQSEQSDNGDLTEVSLLNL